MYPVINDSFQSLKCLIQIFNQVIHIFNPDREADQSIGNSEGFKYFPGDAGVGHDGRMFDQAFNTAKGFGKGEDLAFFEEAFCFLQSFPEDCRHHSTEGRHLF